MRNLVFAGCLALLVCFTNTGVAQQASTSTNTTASADASVTGSEAHPALVSTAAMDAHSVKKTKPQYSAAAIQARIRGAVVLMVVVDTTGHIVKATAMSGPEALRDSAVDCVKQWIYKPYMLNGQPVFVRTTVTVNFGALD